MSKHKYLDNERYCREQADRSVGDREKWLAMANEWATLAAAVARPTGHQIQQQQQPQKSPPEDE
ncbi:MAG: hypothetical protein AB1490_00985 [Pseudomonadota bacterium]